MTDLSVKMGVLAPSLVEQLKPYGLKLDQVQSLQDLNHAITRLYLAEVLTETEKERARKRLMKRITDAVKEVQRQ
ncbi:MULTISPECIES: hypothetical protein [Pseudomonas]|uniref:Uncharacterized protein n=2 Tax=Pseudomonas TaxID=286 RepID=A0A2X2CBW7_PSELU|nr:MULTISPECIES: hypothetical protein [Pseudomonas]SER23144.1 hypothetical protein SAMN05216409_114108 [Pseudomonas lutea]SPZ04988.1 Uncharacterised protein [Pseudomonas luteola]